MKNKIGEGFYYNVYDIGNNRVRKEITTHASRIKKLLSWGSTAEFGLRDIFSPKKDHEKLSKSIETSKEILKAIGPESFGNPVFINQFEYEQDKAVPLEVYFKNHSEEESLSMVREYVNFLYVFWQYGFADVVYNFSINCGVSEKTGNFIYFDFNELSTKRDKVISDIVKKKWLTQHSLRDFPANLKSLKTKIISLFSEHITLEALDKYWPIR